MIISQEVKENMKSASKIREFFEKGNELKAKYGEENVADLCLGDPVLEPPKKFIDDTARLLKSGEKGMHRYMPNLGYPNVRKKVAEYLNKKKYFENISEKHVCMTVGAAGGLNVTLKTILNPGEEVIIIKPYFVEYIFYTKNHQGKPVLVDSNEDFSLNIGNIEKAITEKTKAVIINTPNNPTGKVYDKKELKNLAELLKGTEISIISDEPYREIIYSGEHIPITKLYNNSFMVYSFSKSLSIQGERIGYIATNPKIQGVEEIQGGISFANRTLGYVNAPALWQRAIANALEERIDVNHYRRKKERIEAKLKEYGYKFGKPEGTFYFFIKTPREEKKFIDEALEKLLLVAPGSTFGKEGWFRIAYCTTDQQIDLGLKILKELA